LWRRRKRRSKDAADVAELGDIKLGPEKGPYLLYKAELEDEERRRHGLEAEEQRYEMCGEDSRYEMLTGGLVGQREVGCGDGLREQDGQR